MTTDLPEPPHPDVYYRIHNQAAFERYVEQYGIACWNAAIEAAAGIVEREAFPSERSRFGVAADNIRALTKGTT